MILSENRRPLFGIMLVDAYGLSLVSVQVTETGWEISASSKRPGAAGEVRSRAGINPGLLIVRISTNGNKSADMAAEFCWQGQI